MDILSHALWSLVLLPGPASVEKAAVGMSPDLIVFIPGFISTLLKKKDRPSQRSREEMMKWFHRKDNQWIINFYRWTHSLVVWTALSIPLILLIRIRSGLFPWFLLAAPLHIIMDIPTHTHDSFPVQFLTPFSRMKIDGIHWSETRILALNYTAILLTGLLRIFILKYWMCFKKLLIVSAVYCLSSQGGA